MGGLEPRRSGRRGHPQLVLKPTHFGHTGMGADFRSTASAGPGAGDDGPLGRSVMKWSADGELSALDLQQILTRLSSADVQAAGLMACPVDPL